MTLLDQWQHRRREIERALAERRIDPNQVAGELAHLEHRLKRRPLILKRRKDRKAWLEAQAAKRAAARLSAERAREIEQVME